MTGCTCGGRPEDLGGADHRPGCGEEKPSGSLDFGKTKLIDAREYALIITIDLNGVAAVQSQRIDKAQAAQYLRYLADAFAERVPDGDL